MLREPSFKPPVNPSEDGEVGASDDDEDDDEESETEVEGGHEHGDSEDETETEGKGKGKGKKKAVPLRQRLTGTGPAAKGKGKQKTAASPGAGIAPVTEEPGTSFKISQNEANIRSTFFFHVVASYPEQGEGIIFDLGTFHTRYTRYSLFHTLETRNER
jgi:hypothetical protein